MLVVRCKDCNKELHSKSGRSQSCGCPNMTTIKGDSVTALDLSRVDMINSGKSKENALFTPSELAWQEERRKRKVRKLDFEVR